MEVLDSLALGFETSLNSWNLLYCLIGVTLGTAVGVLPGLGPTGAIAILLPVTFKMELAPSIIMLAGIYYGAQFGGSITSILLNIPGEAAGVVTCYDGHPMARKGRAGAALGISAFGSFIGGTLGVFALALVAPSMSKMALSMGPIEYTWLLIVGLSLVIFLCSKSVVKGLLMAAAGFLLGTVGMDPISGEYRFTFGSQTLTEGLNVGLVAMGIFGLGEILHDAAEKGRTREIIPMSTRLLSLLPNRHEWRQSGNPIARGTILGFLLGCLPGGGAVIASFLSYALEKRISRTPEKFGNGAIEGVAGPETANNAAASGAFVPLLTLGIPPNVVMALLVGAFMLHGVTPGPTLVVEKPEIFWGIVTSVLIGNVFLLILNVPLIGLFVRILRVRQSVLSPLIIVLCVVGSYSLNGNPTDVAIMFFFGFVGYLIRRFSLESAPLMLAFVLGPILEKELRRSLILSHGDPTAFLHSPIAVALFLTALLIYVSPFLGVLKRARLRTASSVSDD